MCSCVSSWKVVLWVISCFRYCLLVCMSVNVWISVVGVKKLKIMLVVLVSVIEVMKWFDIVSRLMLVSRVVRVSRLLLVI